MVENFIVTMKNFYEQNIIGYIQTLYEYPIKLVLLVLDISIVVFLGIKLLKIVKDSRAWQLLKGIALLIIATALSSIFKLRILNYILTHYLLLSYKEKVLWDTLQKTFLIDYVCYIYFIGQDLMC